MKWRSLDRGVLAAAVMSAFAVLPLEAALAAPVASDGQFVVAQFAPIETRPGKAQPPTKTEPSQTRPSSEPRKRGAISDQIIPGSDRCEVVPPCPSYCREDLKRNICVEGQPAPPP